MAALYDHYVVIGSKIDFQICGSTSNEAALAVSFTISDTPSMTLTVPNQVWETSTGKLLTIPAASNNTYRKSMKWSAKKYFGKGVLANVDLQGTASASPTEQSFFCINMVAINGTTTSAVFVEAKITYIAVWKELKMVALS